MMLENAHTLYNFRGSRLDLSPYLEPALKTIIKNTDNPSFETTLKSIIHALDKDNLKDFSTNPFEAIKASLLGLYLNQSKYLNPLDFSKRLKEIDQKDLFNEKGIWDLLGDLTGFNVDKLKELEKYYYKEAYVNWLNTQKDAFAWKEGEEGLRAYFYSVQTYGSMSEKKHMRDLLLDHGISADTEGRLYRLGDNEGYFASLQKQARNQESFKGSPSPLTQGLIEFKNTGKILHDPTWYKNLSEEELLRSSKPYYLLPPKVIHPPLKQGEALPPKGSLFETGDGGLNLVIENSPKRQEIQHFISPYIPPAKSIIESFEDNRSITKIAYNGEISEQILINLKEGSILAKKNKGNIEETLWTDKEGYSTLTQSIKETELKLKKDLSEEEAEELWKKTFNLKDIKDTYYPKIKEEIKPYFNGKELQLTKFGFDKMLRRGRAQYIPLVKPTLEEPAMVIKHQDALLFIRELDDKYVFASVGKEKDDIAVVSSNANREFNNIRNKLFKENSEIIYRGERFEQLADILDLPPKFRGISVETKLLQTDGPLPTGEIPTPSLNQDVGKAIARDHSTPTPPKSQESLKEVLDSLDEPVILKDYLSAEDHHYSKAQRKAYNLEALKVLGSLGERAATKEEQEILSRFSGFGGIPMDEKELGEIDFILAPLKLEGSQIDSLILSSQNAYYTPKGVIDAIYQHLSPYLQGKILEPSLGNGRFFLYMPKEALPLVQRIGVELDPISSRIAKALHPNAKIYNQNFKDFNEKDFDIVIGNPPYGESRIKGMPLSLYFLSKSIDVLKEGGLSIQIVNAALMDNPSHKAFRMNLAKKADLLGMLRLPDDTFSGTSVNTDLLIFQKKKAPLKDSLIDSSFDAEWIGTHKVDGFSLNDYYKFNPNHLLGELSVIEGRFGSKLSLRGNLDDLSEKLGEIFSKVQDINPKSLAQEAFYKRHARSADMNASSMPYYSTFIHEDRMYFKGLEGLEEIPMQKHDKELVQGYHDIKDALKALKLKEARNDSGIEPLRKELKEHYDAFYSKFGKLAENKRLKQLFKYEPSYENLKSLDSHNSLHPILTQRMIYPRAPIPKPQNIKDALSYFTSHEGETQYKDLVLALGKDKVDEALKNQEIFKLHDSRIESKEVFLSGNLGEKIDFYEQLEGFSLHVKALKEALPPKKAFKDIPTPLNADYIDPSLSHGFVSKLEKGLIPSYYPKGFQKAAHDLLHGTYTFYKDPLKAQTYERNRAKLEKDFRKFLLQNDQAERITERYNELYNRSVPKKTPKITHIEGMNPEIRLRDHQLDAISFAIHNPTSLFDHSVGSGKTFALIASAFEFKRLGFAKKPLLVVPNHIIEQFQRDIYKLYPHAKINLIPTQKHARRAALGRILKGEDYDLTLMTHSSFDMVHLSEESLAQLKTSRSLEAKGRGQKALDVKKRAAFKEAQGNILDKGAKEEADFFDTLGFDALLLDEAHIYKNLNFDSKMGRVVRGLGNTTGSHHALNLLYKLEHLKNIKGKIVFTTGTPLSNSISEVFHFMRYLDTSKSYNDFDAFLRQFGEVVSEPEITATGTKVITRLSGMKNLDQLSALYKQFAHVVNTQEVPMDIPLKNTHMITLKASEHQAKFMESLIKRAEKIEEKDPLSAGDNILKIITDASKATLDQRLIDDSLKDFTGSKVNVAKDHIAENYQKYSKDKGVQIVFCDLSAPKARRGLKDEIFELEIKNDTKGLERLARSEGFLNIEELKGSLSFSVYEDLKEKLIKKGIKKEEIAFVHDWDKNREELFRRINSGEIRVIMGSTSKLGSGANIQERISALHHLDFSYKPSDMLQREGRALRQGNSFLQKDPSFKMDVFYYVTENTADTLKLQHLERKAQNIAAFKNSVGASRISEEEALSFGELKARALGNEHLLNSYQKARELSKVDLEISALSKQNEELEYAKAKSEQSLDFLKDEIKATKLDKKVFIEASKPISDLKDIKPDRDTPLYSSGDMQVFYYKQNSKYIVEALSPNGVYYKLYESIQKPTNFKAYHQKLRNTLKQENLDSRIIELEKEYSLQQDRLKSLKQDLKEGVSALKKAQNHKVQTTKAFKEASKHLEASLIKANPELSIWLKDDPRLLPSPSNPNFKDAELGDLSQEAKDEIKERFFDLDAQDALEASSIINQRWIDPKKVENLLGIEPLKEFGENFFTYYRKPKEAIAYLLKNQTGQVTGAFYKEGLGNIDLVWGNEKIGLQKIMQKHKEDFKAFEKGEAGIIEGLNEIVERGALKKENNMHTIYYSKDNQSYKIGLSKGWNKEGDNNWVITAYKVDKSPDPDVRPSDPITKGDGTDLHPNDLPNSSAEGIKDSLAKESPKDKTVINTKAYKTQYSRFKKVKEAQQKAQQNIEKLHAKITQTQEPLSLAEESLLQTLKEEGHHVGIKDALGLMKFEVSPKAYNQLQKYRRLKHTLSKTQDLIQEKTNNLKDIELATLIPKGHQGVHEKFGKFDTLFNAKTLRRFAREGDYGKRNDEEEVVNPIRRAIEDAIQLKPLKEFGNNYAEFYHDAQGAITKLLTMKEGQVAGAFFKEGLGDIDLVWGEVKQTGKEAKGYGLSKIIEKHIDDFASFKGDIKEERLMNGLSEIMEKGNTVKTHNGYNIILDDYKIGLNEGWNLNGKKIGDNKWIVTAFDNSKSISEKQGSNSASFTKPETLGFNSPSNPTTKESKKEAIYKKISTKK